VRFRRSRERPTPAKHPCDFGIRFRHPLSQRAEQLAAKLADVRFRTHASGFDRPILASQVLAGERSESPCLSGDPQHIPRAHPAARRDRERGRVVGGRVPRSVGRCSAPDGGDLRDTPRHRTAALDSQLDPEPAPEPRAPQAGGGISRPPVCRGPPDVRRRDPCGHGQGGDGGAGARARGLRVAGGSGRSGARCSRRQQLSRGAERPQTIDPPSAVAPRASAWLPLPSGWRDPIHKRAARRG